MINNLARAIDLLVVTVSRLYIYSGGVSDIEKSDGDLLRVEVLIDFLSRAANEKGSRVERVLNEARGLQAPPELRDDCSLVEVEFN